MSTQFFFKILTVCLFFMTDYLHSDESININLKNKWPQHLSILSHPQKKNELLLVISPTLYDPNNDTDASVLLNTSFCNTLVVTIDFTRHQNENDGSSVITNAFSSPIGAVTNLMPIGFWKNKIVLANAEIDGLTWRRNTPGINPIDQIFISFLSTTIDDFRESSLARFLSNTDTQHFISAHEKRPYSTYVPPSVFTLSGMFDGKVGYCVGCSGQPNNPYSETYLWISTFSAPEFQVTRWSNNNTRQGKFTHIAAAFLGDIPLIAYRNSRDNSIGVIDYDEQKMLENSTLRKVELPEKFSDSQVESLL
ncbi:MAG: hypothetical protein ACRCUY_06965, partial [Thermoguttaceae bacterium]